MKNLKTLLLGLFVVATTSLTAQIEHHLPADAAIVVEMNFGHLDEKYDLGQIRELNLWNFMMGEAKNELPPAKLEMFQNFTKDPTMYGFDGLAKSYFFMRIPNGEDYEFGFIGQLTDARKAEQFIDGLDESVPETMIEGGMKYKQIDKDAVLAWNDQFIFMGGMDANSIPWEERQDKMPAMTKAWSGQVLKGFTKNLGTNPGWLKSQRTQDDFSLFLNYAYLQDLMGEESGQEEMKMGLSMMGLDGLAENYDRMYEDMYLEAALNFNDGAIVMSTDLFMNDRMQQIYQKANSSGFHNKMVKYINGEELLGFYHFNYDLAGALDGIKSYVTHLNDGERPAAFDMMEEGTELMGIKLNEKTITEMVTGDILVAINGIRMVEQEVTEYEYDEDFNATPVVTTQEVPMPIFTAVSHYDEDDQWENLLELGQDMEFLTPAGKLFKVNIPDMDLDLWLGMRDNLIVLTNDPALSTKKGLKKGYGKRNMPSTDVLRMLNENNQTFFVDFDAAIEAANKMQVMDVMTGMAVGMVQQQLESFVIRAPRSQINTGHADMMLNMKDDDTNSLKSVLEFVDMIMGTMGMTGSRS